jgi:bacterioferritin-associated ferredoxin
MVFGDGLMKMKQKNAVMNNFVSMFTEMFYSGPRSDDFDGMTQDQIEYLKKQELTIRNGFIVCTTCGSNCGQCLTTNTNGMTKLEFLNWYEGK